MADLICFDVDMMQGYAWRIPFSTFSQIRMALYHGRYGSRSMYCTVASASHGPVRMILLTVSTDHILRAGMKVILVAY